jgi:hypothetical protein
MRRHCEIAAVDFTQTTASKFSGIFSISDISQSLSVSPADNAGVIFNVWWMRTAFPSDKPPANVRQMLGRPGEAWGGESGTDRIVVVRD